MSDQRTKVLLASEYHADEIRQVIVPKLRALGLEPRVVDLTHDGPLHGYAAVLYMIGQSNHSKHDSFKARADRAGIPFVPLTRASVTWPIALRKRGLRVLDAPVVHATPAAPSPAEDAPPPPSGEVAVAVPNETAGEPRPFHTALAEERSGAGLTQRGLAKTLGVSRLVVANLEHARCAPSKERYEALCTLFPKLASSPPPRFGHPPPAHPAPRQPRVAPAAVGKGTGKAPAKSTPAPKVVPVVPKFPLDAIRKAARALNLSGSLDVKVNIETGAAKVSVSGETPWEGRSATEAVTSCRIALEKRLRDRCTKLQTEEETIRAVLADLAA